MKRPLTKPEKRVLSYIRDCQKIGYTPSQRECAQALGYRSPFSVFRILNQLENHGYISKPRGNWIIVL